jgi:hypothetical protein
MPVEEGRHQADDLWQDLPIYHELENLLRYVIALLD